MQKLVYPLVMLIGVIVPYVTLSDETAHAEPQFYAGAFVGLGNFDNQFEDVEGFVGYGENYQLDYDDSDTHFGALAGIQWQLEGFDIAVEFDLSSLNISTDKVADPVGLDETVSSEMDGFAAVRTQVAIPLTERFSVHAAFGLAVTEIQNEFVDLDWYWIDEAAGIAEQRFDPDDSFSDDSVEWGMLVSAGAEFDYSEQWTFRLDVTRVDFGSQDYWVNTEGFTNKSGVFVGRKLYTVDNELILTRFALLRKF